MKKTHSCVRHGKINRADRDPSFSFLKDLPLSPHDHDTPLLSE